MDKDQAGRMQMQLRHNAEDLQSYLCGLDSWEKEMKLKDESLRKKKPILKEKLPPVRSHGPRAANSHRKKKEAKKNKDKAAKKESIPEAPKISSYDYRAWDRFDVDKACEDVDYQVKSSSGSEEEGEEEEEETLEEERRRQQAVLQKEKGNNLFKEGKYEQAVECYTVAIELDPLSAIFPANRALALLKLERYGAAEKDCSVALALDGSYVKAYLRRGTARREMGRVEEARLDFQAVLELEAGNRQAKSEIATLEKHLKSNKNAQQSRYITAVKRPAHLRSKKPLRLIPIEDIGMTEEETRKEEPAISLVAGVEPSPNESKRADQEESPQTKLSDSPPTLEATRLVEADLKTKDEQGDSNVGSSDQNTAATPTQPDRSDQGRTAEGGHGKDENSQETAAEKTAEVVTTTKPSGGELVIPSVPETSIQFQSDWKRLKKDQTALSQYFKTLPPSKYPSLLQQSLETNVLSDIIFILHRDFVRCGRSCLDELRWLTKVKRFSVAVMFLSKAEKEGALQFFKDLQALARGNEVDSEQLKAVSTLAGQFGIRL